MQTNDILHIYFNSSANSIKEENLSKQTDGKGRAEKTNKKREKQNQNQNNNCTKVISMASRDKRRESLEQTLQQLRDVTNSTALNKASIIADASKYIEELKQKVEGLNSELGITESSSNSQIDELPAVTVKTLKKGFLINVLLEKNSPGMLVSVLEAFEELGLDVLDARVSCEDSFQLEAVGREVRQHT
ncbi:hypothetical protein V8G54_022446 [Vigna mungo]|uniref:ACT domain-containing protein n=1 Tax=Vigna mungo TaxID=3915 RepID=A0AAQ3NHM0_VIGMU